MNIAYDKNSISIIWLCSLFSIIQYIGSCYSAHVSEWSGVAETPERAVWKSAVCWPDGSRYRIDVVYKTH